MKKKKLQGHNSKENIENVIYLKNGSYIILHIRDGSNIA